MSWKASAAAALLFAASVVTSANQAVAQTVLRYSPWLPAGYVLNEPVLRPWMDQIAEVTDGRVRVEWLPMAVGSASAQFDVVTDGLADMSIILPGYTPGRFPLMEIGELPLLAEDPAILSPVFNRIYDRHLAEFSPFQGAVLLSVWASTPTHIVNSRRVVEDVEDLRGLKMRAPSSTALAIMDELGIVPVQRPVSEMYELASTGIVDGTFFPLGPIVDWGVVDHLRYVTLVPGGMGQSVMAILVNEAKWNAIDEADRQAILQISGEHVSRAAGIEFKKGEGEKREILLEAGVSIEPSSDTLLDQLQEKLEPVDQAWIENAEAAGLVNAAEVLADLRAELAAEMASPDQ